MGSLEADVVIIGGGPVGLALCIGLVQLGFKVFIIEKDSEDVNDWSKAYSYRLDVRGLNLMRRLGLFTELIEIGVISEGFSSKMWNPDDSFTNRAAMALGSTGYWLQRPHLLSFLSSKVASGCIVKAEAKQIMFEHGCVTVHITQTPTLVNMTASAISTVKAKHIFGCDGIRSIVRTVLNERDEEFRLQKINSISAGLCFKATLMQPPEGFKASQGYSVVGKSGYKLTMLPFSGKDGEPRPIAYPPHRLKDTPLQPKTPEELFTMLDKDFPQLNARKRMSLKSATMLCKSEGSTFPNPRWAGKAVTIVNSVVAALLGDALHSFPPDLGQGVNSGMTDVGKVLDLMEEVAAIEKEKGSKSAGLSEYERAEIRANLGDDSTPNRLKTAVAELNKDLVLEAAAICRLIPIGFPYQYTLPWTLHKVMFFAWFLTRFGLFTLLQRVSALTGWPNPLYAPVVVQIQDDPPQRYDTILRRHHWNSGVLLSMGVVLCAILVGAVCGVTKYGGCALIVKGLAGRQF